MCSEKVRVSTLKVLQPLGSLSEARLNQLAALCRVESIGRAVDPFAARPVSDEAAYLTHGELALSYADGFSRVVVGGSEEARLPLGRSGEAFSTARAITDVEILRIDANLLDLMLTWDQLAPAGGRPRDERAASGTVQEQAGRAILSGMFGGDGVKYEAFAHLPPANVDELLRRFERVPVRKGDVIVREGTEGDFYYVIESGRCKVDRMIGGVAMLLAELKGGDAFGEEALVSEAKRNATVTMKSEGVVLRLAKADFSELLREPMLRRLSIEEARKKIAAGGQWIDVRYPSEFQYDRFPGAINIPLSEIRDAFPVMDREREYVLYCQSERRSAAAAFLLAQKGFLAFVLAGGLWASADPAP